MKPIDEYGIFAMGMAQEEIKEYLVIRYNEKRNANQKKCLKSTYNKFCEIAGANTQSMVVCPCCKKAINLMYRHDVKRFADKLFLNLETYFD